MNSAKKIILAVAVSLGALGSGFFNWSQREVIADAPPELPEWLKQFPQYPNSVEMRPFSLGDEIKINGLPMQSSYFHSPDSVMQIRNFYEGIWQSQGKHPEVVEADDHTIVRINNDEAQFLSVLIIDQKNERLIMPTVNEMAFEIPDKEPTVFRLPVPADTHLVHNMETVAEGLASATTIYALDMSMADSHYFYSQSMPQIGFKLVAQDTIDDMDIETYRAGKVTVRLTYHLVTEAPPQTMITSSYLEEP